MSPLANAYRVGKGGTLSEVIAEVEGMALFQGSQRLPISSVAMPVQ
ncbi:MAG: hypothetical protein WBC61_06090 [Dehalococcoidia bacterium]